MHLCFVTIKEVIIPKDLEKSLTHSTCQLMLPVIIMIIINNDQ